MHSFQLDLHFIFKSMKVMLQIQFSVEVVLLFSQYNPVYFYNLILKSIKTFSLTALVHACVCAYTAVQG